MVDHLSSHCTQKALVYVETKEQEREPRKDKRMFLLSSCQQNGIQVHIIEADDRNRISPENLSLISQTGVVVFDRLCLVKSFEALLEKHGLVLGTDVRGAILEDDWMGGHEHWTRWSNQRLELGSLAVDYLSFLLQRKSLDDFQRYTPLHLVISESSAFPSF